MSLLRPRSLQLQLALRLALLYLASDASRFVTGQVLYLDGGYTSC